MVVGGLQQQKHPPRPRMMEMHNGSEQCACMFRSTRTPFMEMVAVLRCCGDDARKNLQMNYFRSYDIVYV